MYSYSLFQFRSFIRYDDPTEKLCNTDVDKLENAPEPMGIEGNCFSEANLFLELSAVCILDGKYLALKVEFTLGTSQYATMALREIMRAETSSQAQSSIVHD